MREILRFAVWVIFSILLVISVFQGRYDAASFSALMLILFELEKMNRTKDDT